MSLEMLFDIGEIACYVVSAVLFFKGLKKMAGYLREEGENAPLLKKESIKILGIACGCYALARFCSLFIPMGTEEFDLTAIIVESVWQAIYHTGFLVLLPLVIKGKNVKKD